MVRLNRSQMSIILTYEVFGSELDTLINLIEGGDHPSTQTNITTPTYIVVNTNITVKLTVMIASKKKGLK